MDKEPEDYGPWDHKELVTWSDCHLHFFSQKELCMALQFNLSTSDLLVAKLNVEEDVVVVKTCFGSVLMELYFLR